MPFCYHAPILPFQCSSESPITVQGNGFVGKDPFHWYGWYTNYLSVAIKEGSFSSNKDLQLSDFRAPASLSTYAASGGCYGKGKCIFHMPFFMNKINVSGLTQFRLFFNDNTNLNSKPDNYQIFTGDTSVLANKPMLEVRYYP